LIMQTHQSDSIRKDCREVIGPCAAGLDQLKNQKVYITGGTGFVGSWLAELVACLNDDYGFNTGLILAARDTDAFREKAPHLASRADVQLASVDVRNLNAIPDDVSYVIHAAASPDNRQHMSDPLSVMDTIAKGTAAVLDCAARLPGLKKMLNISSGQVYGRPHGDSRRISEGSFGALTCNSITAVYPEAKRYAETLCCAFWSLHKIPVLTARPFAFVGPYQSLEKPWAINNFIRDAQMNSTIRIIGNGSPVRSYLYPSDMAYWLLRILTDGNPGLAYNVGSPEGITLKGLAEKIKFASNTSSEISIRNMNEDHSCFVPDISLCNKSLNLIVTVDIDKTINRSVAWYTCQR
jgi:nucleoside-diphosphate-sugar epimerase